MAKLGDVCFITMGQSPDSATYNEFGNGLPFFQGNADFGKISPTARIWCSEPKKIANPDDILISIRAPIGALNIADIKCCIGRGLASLNINDDKGIKKYIWYALKSKANEMISKGTGSTFKAIGKDILYNLEIPLPPLENQRKIAENLDKVTRLIDLFNNILDKIDLLVKSRFVEMFGDVKSNQHAYEIKPMTEVCEIIDGDRGKNYPKQEEFLERGYCLFLNAKNVTANGFDFTSCMFVTKEKDELLRKGKLSRGDVVLTTRGTIGNLAFYTDAIPFENGRINSGMGILKMNKAMVSVVFFIEQFKMCLTEIKEGVASGSAQPQLPISTMNKIRFLVPPIALQKQFVAFVEQTDKSKSAVKKVLEKAETLKKALMQEYFG